MIWMRYIGENFQAMPVTNLKYTLNTFANISRMLNFELVNRSYGSKIYLNDKQHIQNCHEPCKYILIVCKDILIDPL